MRSVAIAALTLSLIGVVACGADPKPPPAAPAGDTEPAEAEEPIVAPADSGEADDDPSQSQINISDEILKACGISESDAHFAFNSAHIRPQDHKVLGQLAQCFSSGPLKGRQMRLVGHADPRGEPEYNLVLGGRRADNVKAFIAQKGLDSSRMSSTSRGEMDATGTDEASWARDRRVDILLGD